MLACNSPFHFVMLLYSYLLKFDSLYLVSFCSMLLLIMVLLSLVYTLTIKSISVE